MIPQEQMETKQSEVQAPLPIEETPFWRTWSFWLRVLGVIVALGAGFALAFPISLPIEIPLVVFLLVPVLVGVVSAGLLRSWWAMLVVPIAYSVSFFLSNILQTGGFDFQSWAASNFEGVDILLALNVVPLAIGVAIGTSLGKRIERRLQR